MNPHTHSHLVSQLIKLANCNWCVNILYQLIHVKVMRKKKKRSIKKVCFACKYRTIKQIFQERQLTDTAEDNILRYKIDLWLAFRSRVILDNLAFQKHTQTQTHVDMYWSKAPHSTTRPSSATQVSIYPQVKQVLMLEYALKI